MKAYNQTFPEGGSKFGTDHLDCTIVQSTISMHSMLILGGSGACPPGKF